MTTLQVNQRVILRPSRDNQPIYVTIIGFIGDSIKVKFDSGSTAIVELIMILAIDEIETQ